MITANGWKPPLKEEVDQMFKLTGCGSKQELAERIGYKSKRALEKWVSGENTVPFTAWFTIKAIARENAGKVLGECPKEKPDPKTGLLPSKG